MRTSPQLLPNPVLGYFGFVIYLIPFSIILWQLYNKAGRPGWQALIPGYNNIVMAEISKSPRWAGYLGAAGSLLQFSQYFVVINPAKEFRPVVAIVLITCNLAALYLFVRLTRMFDRGIGFWLGVIFLPVLTMFFAKRARFIGEAVEVSAPPNPST